MASDKFVSRGGKKLQYEADRKDLIKGVLPPEKAARIKDQVVKRIYDLGFKVQEELPSPILGGAGNKEYLLTFY